MLIDTRWHKQGRTEQIPTEYNLIAMRRKELNGARVVHVQFVRRDTPRGKCLNLYLSENEARRLARDIIDSIEDGMTRVSKRYYDESALTSV